VTFDKGFLTVGKMSDIVRIDRHCGWWVVIQKGIQYVVVREFKRTYECLFGDFKEMEPNRH